MAVERRQLRRYQENDKRRCLAAKAISQPDAADGWRAAHARSAIGGRSICVEHKPSSFTQSQLNCIRSKEIKRARIPLRPTENVFSARSSHQSAAAGVEPSIICEDSVTGGAQTNDCSRNGSGGFVGPRNSKFLHSFILSPSASFPSELRHPGDP